MNATMFGAAATELRLCAEHDLSLWSPLPTELYLRLAKGAVCQSEEREIRERYGRLVLAGVERQGTVEIRRGPEGLEFRIRTREQYMLPRTAVFAQLLDEDA